MNSSMYSGRKVQKDILKNFLAGALGQGRNQTTVNPRVFLFYGENGLGKSSLIDICVESIEELFSGAENPAIPVVIDFEAWRFKNGHVPKTKQEMLDAIYMVAAGTHQKLHDGLVSYNNLIAKIAETELVRQRYLVEEWPHDIFLGSNAQDIGYSDFRFRLEQRINPADLALCDDPVRYCTAMLAECFVTVSQKVPLALCIDGLELVSSPELSSWLTHEFLPSMLEKTSTIALVLSGAHSFIRVLRNQISEELLYPVSLSDLTLTRNNIIETANARNQPITAEQAEQIELATGGIPLVVQTMLDRIRMDIPLTNAGQVKAADAQDARRLIQAAVEEFIRYEGDETAKKRIFFLAMLYRFDENILGQLWGIPTEEVPLALAELAQRYSFIHGRMVHGAVRDALRAYLIAEAARGPESSLAEHFQSFSSITSSVHVQYLTHTNTEIPDAARRFADPSYQVTVLGYLNSLFWASQHEAMKLAPGFFIEALHYNQSFATNLLGFADEFKPLLTKESLTLIAMLRSCLAVASILKSPIEPGNYNGDGAVLDVLNGHLMNMTDIQRGLLHHIRGVIACRADDFDRAMDEFNTSAGLFRPSSSERHLLFTDFLWAGYAFINRGEKRKAVDTLKKAVAIEHDNFFAWREMAAAQKSLGEHEDAVVSFCKAVNLVPNDAETWLELGNEYAVLGRHEHAVESFTRAVEFRLEWAGAWFKLGISNEAIARYPEAQKALEQTVQLSPEHWEAWFALGRSQSAQNFRDEAIDSFWKVVSIKTDEIEAWKALGNELYATGSYKEAADALEKAAQIDTKDPLLWNSIGKAWFGARNYENAVRACQNAVELRKEIFEAWSTLGASQTELSNFQAAYEAFSEAAQLNPKDQDVWVNVGNSLYAQAKYKESIDAYLKAVELRPSADSLWHNIGLAYQVQRKFAEAIEAFQKAIDINPNVAETWYQQGRSYAELNQHSRAAMVFTKAVELSPDAHDAWYRKGLALARAGNHDEAIPAFAKASELNPSDTDIWYHLGLSFAVTGKAAEAAQAFSQSLAISDKRPEAHYQLGLARESLGLYEEATVAHRNSTALSPEKVEAWQHLGLCLNILARYEEALPPLRKVLELAPNNKDVLLPIALASHAVGDFAQAVYYYRKVIDFKPDSQEAWYNCALAHHALNDYQSAITAYQRVVKLWPDNDQAWYNMGLAFHASDDLPKAIMAYREATRLNPESADTWYNMGLAFYGSEQYGESIQAFRKVISRAPDKYEAWYNLGNAYLIWHEYNDAIESYKKAAEIKSDNYAAWGYLGSAYYAARNYPKAVEMGTKAFELKSDEPWIIGTLALAKFCSGDPAAAGILLDKLLAADSQGQEIAKTATELQNAITMNPSLAGGAELMQKFFANQ